MIPPIRFINIDCEGGISPKTPARNIPKTMNIDEKPVTKNIELRKIFLCNTAFD